jgi:EAL domain-containing protein (putative c-di-GMP-specific phosphodiesterase class I)
MASVAEMTHSDKRDTGERETWRRQLHQIIQTRQLSAVFQPILDLHQAKVIGVEGLIRGPTSSKLHAPHELFGLARACGMVAKVEQLARHIILKAFAEQASPGKIFVNASPDILVQHVLPADRALTFIAQLGLRPDQIIIEITENIPTVDYQRLREATQHYRRMGFQIAIDDLGEGFSGLRLWSEIRPDYIKVDQYFIHNIHLDPIKLQFVRSLQAIAVKTGARVIAEGIESPAELAAIHRLGIAYGQGYWIARPSASPSAEVSEAIRRSLLRGRIACGNQLEQWAWNPPLKATMESRWTRSLA